MAAASWSNFKELSCWDTLWMLLLLGQNRVRCCSKSLWGWFKPGTQLLHPSSEHFLPMAQRCQTQGAGAGVVFQPSTENTPSTATTHRQSGPRTPLGAGSSFQAPGK